MKKILFILLFLLAIGGKLSIYSQDFYLLAKFPNEATKRSVVMSNNTMDLKSSSSKKISLEPAYPGAKNPELHLYYNVIGYGDKDQLIQELKNERKFDKIIAYESNTKSTTTCPFTGAVTNDPLADYSTEMIQANCAWEISTGNKDIIIGIVDAGFDDQHEDLRDKFVSVITINKESLYRDEHGTLCAGVAAASSNNGIGIRSIGYNTRLKGYIIGKSNYWIAKGTWQAYLDGCNIINVSHESTGLASEAAKEITDYGTVLVVGAGNYSNSLCHSTIADVPGVINVSGSNKHGGHVGSFAKNQYVDLCAPGEDILTTTLTSLGKYKLDRGSSIAAPFVAGTAALVMDVNPCLKPAQIEEIIKSTTTPLVYASPGTGTGNLNAYGAVLKAAETATTTLSNQQISGSRLFHTNYAIRTNNGVKLLSGSNVTMKTRHDVTLTGDFEVEAGGQLSIDVHPDNKVACN